MDGSAESVIPMVPLERAYLEQVLGDDLSFAAATAMSFGAIGCLYALESVLSEKELERPHANVVRFAAKCIGSIGFLVAAMNLAAAMPVVDASTTLMLVALILCAVGDLFLVRESTFTVGLFTFLAGHVGFALSFMAAGLDPYSAALAVPLLLPVLLAVKVYLFPLVPKAQLGMVQLYSLAIYAMAVLAAGTRRHDTFIAALLFIASDIGVSLGHFVRTTAATRASVFLYYAAQAIFAHTISHRSSVDVVTAIEEATLTK